MFIFNYGTDTIEDFAKALGFAGESYPAYVEGYDREYFGHNKFWDGGTVSLVPKENARVYGYIIALPNTDLDEMTKNIKDVYRKHSVRIMADLGDGLVPLIGVAYVARDQENRQKPSMKYLSAIAKNVSDHWGDKLPRETGMNLAANPRKVKRGQDMPDKYFSSHELRLGMCIEKEFHKKLKDAKNAVKNELYRYPKAYSEHVKGLRRTAKPKAKGSTKPSLAENEKHLAAQLVENRRLDALESKARKNKK